MLNGVVAEELVVCTVGHSTRPLETFLTLLKSNDIRLVLDVRTVPRSRHNPQFNLDSLPDSLATVDIHYMHMSHLGGLRKTHADSPNIGWHNLSFRGYADYMQTPEFEHGVKQVVELAMHERCVLMCAEAVPWRCHRSLIADALTVRGVRVEDIIAAEGRKPHVLTPWAKIDGLAITYPVEIVDNASVARKGENS